MKYIVLIATALFGAAIQAPNLPKTKETNHPAHDATGVSNPLLNRTKGDGLKHEFKTVSKAVEAIEKERIKKKSRWPVWKRILLYTSCILIGTVIGMVGMFVVGAIITGQVFDTAITGGLEFIGSVTTRRSLR